MSQDRNPGKRPTPEQINAMMAENSPFHRLMEVIMESVSEQETLCRMPLKEEFFHAGGYLHGGITYALADAAVAMLLLWRVGFDREVFTIEGKLNYLASVPMGTEGSLVCKAKAVHVGKTTAVVDTDVYSDRDRLLCHGLFTYAIR